MQAYSVPCCGSVGGCGARAVSRKTPIYFITFYIRWLFCSQNVNEREGWLQARAYAADRGRWQNNDTENNGTRNNDTENNYNENNDTENNGTGTNYTKNNDAENNDTENNDTGNNGTGNNYTKNNDTENNDTENNDTGSNHTKNNDAEKKWYWKQSHNLLQLLIFFSHSRLTGSVC